MRTAWPSLNGFISKKAKTLEVSNSLCDGMVPLIILQKMQLSDMNFLFDPCATTADGNLFGTHRINNWATRRCITLKYTHVQGYQI
jgi:hypothetical protein